MPVLLHPALIEVKMQHTGVPACERPRRIAASVNALPSPSLSLLCMVIAYFFFLTLFAYDVGQSLDSYIYLIRLYRRVNFLGFSA